MAHNRKLVLGAVDLTTARGNRYVMDVMGDVMDELEQVVLTTNYLANAPFKWVGLMLRFGLKNEGEPHYQRIDKKYGDLPLAIELDTHDLLHASRDELKVYFMIATLKCLVHAGKKYGLPYQHFAELLAEWEAKRPARPPTPEK